MCVNTGSDLISTIENGRARLFRVAVGESTLDGSKEREIAADGSAPLVLLPGC